MALYSSQMLYSQCYWVYLHICVSRCFQNHVHTILAIWDLCTPSVPCFMQFLMIVVSGVLFFIFYFYGSFIFFVVGRIFIHWTLWIMWLCQFMLSNRLFVHLWQPKVCAILRLISCVVPDDVCILHKWTPGNWFELI